MNWTIFILSFFVKRFFVLLFEGIIEIEFKVQFTNSIKSKESNPSSHGGSNLEIIGRGNFSLKVNTTFESRSKTFFESEIF